MEPQWTPVVDAIICYASFRALSQFIVQIRGEEEGPTIGSITRLVCLN